MIINFLFMASAYTCEVTDWYVSNFIKNKYHMHITNITSTTHGHHMFPTRLSHVNHVGIM